TLLQRAMTARPAYGTRRPAKRYASSPAIRAPSPSQYSRRTGNWCLQGVTTGRPSFGTRSPRRRCRRSPGMLARYHPMAHMSPNGEYLGLATLGADLWDAHHSEGTAFLGQLEHYPLEVYSLAFSTDSKLVATGSEDGIVRLWDIAGFNKIRVREYTGKIREYT